MESGFGPDGASWAVDVIGQFGCPSGWLVLPEEEDPGNEAKCDATDCNEAASTVLKGAFKLAESHRTGLAIELLARSFPNEYAEAVQEFVEEQAARGLEPPPKKYDFAVLTDGGRVQSFVYVVPADDSGVRVPFADFYDDADGGHAQVLAASLNGEILPDYTCEHHGLKIVTREKFMALPEGAIEGDFGKLRARVEPREGKFVLYDPSDHEDGFCLVGDDPDALDQEWIDDQPHDALYG